jgi:hypothetical protein
MSAPDVNVKKQQKRHKGPLWGFAIGLTFVAILFVIYMAGVLSPANDGVEGIVSDDQPAAIATD